MNKLVNCRCGGEAHHVFENCWNHRVFCKNCGTRTKVFYTEAEAITVWNRVMGERTATVKDFGHPCGTYGYCSNCGGYCVNEDPYCPHCGIKLEWE